MQWGSKATLFSDKAIAISGITGSCCLPLLLAVAAVAKTKSWWSVVVPCPHGVPKSMPCWQGTLWQYNPGKWPMNHGIMVGNCHMIFLYFLIFQKCGIWWDMVLINLRVGHPGFAWDWLSFTRECAEHLSGHRHRWRDTAADLFWVSSNMARNPKTWTEALSGKPLNWMEDFLTSHVGLLEGNNLRNIYIYIFGGFYCSRKITWLQHVTAQWVNPRKGLLHPLSTVHRHSPLL